MRRWIVGFLILLGLVMPVDAASVTAPPAPDAAAVLVPEQPETFSEGLTTVLREALDYLYPAFRSAAATCFGITAVILLASLVQSLPGATQKVTDMVATVTVALMLLSPSGALIRLGANTVTEISEYGKLLLPVMTAAMAAQGGTATSAALYTGTAFFDALLSGIIASVIVPMIYILLCLSVASCATGEEILGKIEF